MPTGAENVRSWKQAGSEWSAVKVTRLTQIGLLVALVLRPFGRFNCLRCRGRPDQLTNITRRSDEVLE
jgi:hypothetical protein